MGNVYELARKVAKILLDAKAVRISTNPPFTWVSGIKSPIYCDNKLLIGFPEFRDAVVDGFIDTIKNANLEFDYVAGTATGAIPWASFVAYVLKKPLIYIRPEPKKHGTGKQIEGFLPPGQKVLLVEDLVSTGLSSINSALAVRSEGKSEVVKILSIMNYEMEKGKNNLKEAKIELISLTNFTVLAGLAKEIGYIENIENILEFQKDPENWYAKFTEAN